MYIYATSDWAWLSPHTHALPTGLGTCDCVCLHGVLIRRSWEPDTHRQLWPQPQLFVSAQEGSWSSSGVPSLRGVSGVIPMALCLTRRPFRGAPVQSQLVCRTTTNPSLSLFQSQLLAHLKPCFAPIRTTYIHTPNFHCRVFSAFLLEQHAFLCFLSSWLFSPPCSGCQEHSGTLCSKVE